MDFDYLHQDKDIFEGFELPSVPPTNSGFSLDPPYLDYASPEPDKAADIPYFTPNLRPHHERNRSEVSEIASPYMKTHQAFDNNTLSPLKQQEHEVFSETNFEALGQISEHPELDLRKVDLSSLGIGVPNSKDTKSDPISDSFLNELLGDNALLEPFDDLLPPFESRNPPESPVSRARRRLEPEEGDTTIMNNTSMMDDTKGAVPDTANLMSELDQPLPKKTHLRANSATPFEMPKLQPFHLKLRLVSPSRVEKATNNVSYRGIPALNERLMFVDDGSTPLVMPGNPLLASPTHSLFSQTSMPGLPTREIYLRGNPLENSFMVQSVLPVLGAQPMFYPNCEATPPESPSKAMSGLSLSSPTKSPAKNKNLFTLKPAPNGRKRVATAPRSKTGCWTCRIRHKKCDEARPVCKNCAKISLKCDQYYDPKPSYMINDEERKEKLAEIAHIWKNRSKKKDKGFGGVDKENCENVLV